MKIFGVLMSLCVVAQAAMALSESELRLLCPAGAEQKKNAVLRSKLKAMEKGLNAADAKGKTLLMYAAEQDNRVAVCYLVAKGADVAAKDKAGKTAQDYARTASLRELLGACARLGAASGAAMSHEQMERKAQQEGLDGPEARQARLYELAVKPGALGEISDLIRMGADPNKPGPDGRKLEYLPGLTPEYLAYFMHRGYGITPAKKGKATPLRGDLTAPMGRLLLALGVQPEPADEKGCLWAALLGDDAAAAKETLEENAELIRTRAEDGRPLLALAQSAAMVQALTAAGADAKEAGLLAGVLSRSASDPRGGEVVSELLKAGAELPEEALVSFCKAGSGDAGVVQALLKAGANPKAKDAEGNTLLHLLLFNKFAFASAGDAAKALVKAGANPKAKNKAGQSAEQLAKSLGRDDVAKALKKGS